MKKLLSNIETQQLFEKYGIPLPEEGFTNYRDDKEHGMEAIVTMKKDPELGPILTFGLSGVFAYIKDTSSKVAPLTSEDAISMIKETKAYDILKGPSDIGAIADVIEKVSSLSLKNEKITEIEIDPLFVYENGAVVGNAKVVSG